MRVLMTVLLLLLMAVSGASAQSDDPRDLLALAQLAPAESEVFFAARIDDDYLATLNGLVATVAGAGAELGMTLPESLPRIQDLVASVIDANATPEQVDAVLALLGDTAAASTRNVDGREVFALYLTITDREALVAAINPTGLGLNEAGVVGRFTLYRTPNVPTALLVADDLAIITDDDAALIASGDYPKLAEASEFTKTVAALPASAYNALVYISGEVVSQSLGNQPGISLSSELVLGATILDTGALSLDLAFNAGGREDEFAPIDPTFARFIPAGANGVLHGTDLGGLIEMFIATATPPANGTPVQVEEGLAQVGISLEELLTWTSGDYAVFSDIDFPLIMEAFTQNDPTLLPDAFEFALVVEAVDPVLAGAFSTRVGELLSAFATAETTTVSTVMVGTAEVTVLTQAVPNSDETVELAIGANDEVFVAGTFNTVERVLTGAPGLDTEPTYTAAAADLLPNSLIVAYADGSGIAGSVVLTGLATIGTVTVNEVFSDIESALEGSPTAVPQPQSPEEIFAQIQGIYERGVSLVRHATLSMAVTNGDMYVVRATITLGE
jgi:hypothetical protein